MTRLLAGDERAFAEIVTRYQSLLVRVARFYVKSDASAEDVAQDTWIAVLKGVERFEGRSSFKTWLLRILVNRARTTGAKESRILPIDLTWSEGSALSKRFDEGGFWREAPVPFTEAIESGIVNAPMLALVHEQIEKLPDAPRTVVTLRDVEGLSTSEVASLLGLTEANVRVILHRGRSLIRSAIESVLQGGES
ncbi:MAG TPA: sigma-70 family RNA polymerase sigma factor [Acidimicrobiales bacterium]|nr:sigma-70 family RNA polymerase sigma factor [Acidimicrobiales bacterium]